MKLLCFLLAQAPAPVPPPLPHPALPLPENVPLPSPWWIGWSVGLLVVLLIVLVIWLLAYRMEMSVVPAGIIEPLPLQVPDEYHAEPTGDGHIKVVVNVAA